MEGSQGVYITALSNGGLSQGWGIRSNGLSLSAFIGNGAYRTVTSYDMTSWKNDGAIHGVVCTYTGHSGSGELRMYVDRVLHSSASYTGFTDCHSDNWGLGGHGQGFNFGGVFFGLSLSDTVQNSSEVEQWFDDCKTAVDVVDFSSGPSEVWSVRRGANDVPEWWPEENGTGQTAYYGNGAAERYESTGSVQWGW